MNRSLLRRLETGYRLSKAALAVEISRSQSCFVVESGSATTQLQTAITINSVGVQLLSRPLHAQIFLNAEFSLPFSIGMNLSESHLQSHDLDNSQAQWLPNLSFRVPPLE